MIQKAKNAAGCNFGGVFKENTAIRGNCFQLVAMDFRFRCGLGDVGALLWEIIRAAIAKDGDEVNDLMHEFRHFGRASSEHGQLQEFYNDWVELLEEVRYSPWCSDEGVLDQAVSAFQHYGPELRRAEREGRSSGDLCVDTFLEALATEVGTRAQR